MVSLTSNLTLDKVGYKEIYYKEEVLNVTVPIILMNVISLFGNVMVLVTKQQKSKMKSMEQVVDDFVMAIAIIDVIISLVVVKVHNSCVMIDWSLSNVKFFCFGLVLVRGILGASTIFQRCNNSIR